MLIIVMIYFYITATNHNRAFLTATWSFAGGRSGGRASPTGPSNRGVGGALNPKP